MVVAHFVRWRFKLRLCGTQAGKDQLIANGEQ